MSDNPPGPAPGSPPHPEHRRDGTIWDPEVERLDEAECWELISPGGVGRLAYSGRFGLAVLPVNYQLERDSIVFRTPLDSPTDEDLRTGIAGADYQVSFEVDQVSADAQEGWMVLVRGAGHHLDPEDDRLASWEPRRFPPVADTPEHFVRITPTMITGRRLRHR